MPYIDSLDADEQVSAEEHIAALIFDHDYWSEDGTVTEEDAADLGREILKAILGRFRPDLFIEESNKTE